MSYSLNRRKKYRRHSSRKPLYKKHRRSVRKPRRKRTRRNKKPVSRMANLSLPASMKQLKSWLGTTEFNKIYN